MIFDTSEELINEQSVLDNNEIQDRSARVMEKQRRDETKAQEQAVQRNLAANKIVETAPDPTGYDYAEAARLGYDGTPDSDGMVYLPNESHKPGSLVMGGRDLATGRQVTYSPEELRYQIYLNGKRRHEAAQRNRSMNALEKLGGVMAGDIGTEGVAGVASGIMRGLANGGIQFSNDVNSLAGFLTGGYYDVPKIEEIPGMGTWEGLLGELTRFAGGYATAGAAVGQSLSKAPMITQESVKDALAVFSMDPEEGNIVSALKDVFGFEDLDYLDAQQLMENEEELKARLSSVVTDTGIATAVTGGAVVLFEKGIQTARQVSDWLGENNRLLDAAYTQMGDDLIEDGHRLIREGATAINAGVNPEVAEGVAKEAAGTVINAASGLAGRLSKTATGLRQAAKGHIIKGIEEEEFVEQYRPSGAPERIIREAYSRAKQQHRDTKDKAFREAGKMTKAEYAISAGSEMNHPDGNFRARSAPDKPVPKMQVAAYLDAKSKAALGGVRDELTPQNKRRIARQLVKEASWEIQNKGNAVKWYQETLDKAHAIVASDDRFSEAFKDPNMRAAFNFALSVASNGSNVDVNSRFALEQYEQFLKTGKFPIKGTGGGPEVAMKEGFDRFNKMADELGLDTLFKLMNSDFTKTELKAMGFKIGSGEASGEVLPGSQMFGPKIGGGFFTNLQGRWDLPTFDRWWMRTWGRVTGKILQSKPELQAKHLSQWRQAMAGNPELAKEYGVSADMTDEQLAVKGAQTFGKWARKGHPDKTNPFFTGSRAINSWAGEPINAPESTVQRIFMRETVDEALRLLKADGIDMQAAELQALLWYPEQRLWDHLGSTQTNKEQDYAKALGRIIGKSDVPTLAQSSRDTFSQGERAEFTQSRVAQTVRSEYFGPDGTGQSGPYTGKEAKSGQVTRFLARNNRKIPAGIKQTFKYIPRAGNLMKAAGATPVPIHELTDDSLSVFQKAVARSKSENDYGELIGTPEGGRLFMTDGGKSGFSLMPDGDIQGAFNGNRIPMMHLAIQAGGRKIDGPNIGIPSLMGIVGMRPVARVKWDAEKAPADWDYQKYQDFNKGEPDFVYMAYDPDYTGGVNVSDTPYVDSHEAAQRAQDEFLGMMP